MENNTSKIFAQIPANILLDAGLTPFEKAFICLTYYHRFLGTNNLTVSSFSNVLGISRDHMRKQINKFSKSLFMNNYISIHAVKQGINQEDVIVVKFKDVIPNKLDVKNHCPDNFNPAIQDTLTKILHDSKYFSNFRTQDFLDLFEGIEVNELLKAIYYTDKRDIKNPIGYLRSSFANNKFKYSFDQRPIIGTIPEELNKKKIKFGITYADLQKIKSILGNGYAYRGIIYEDQSFALVTEIKKAGRPVNIKNILEANDIPFNVYE